MPIVSLPLLNARSARLRFGLFVALITASIWPLSANAQGSCGSLSGGQVTCSSTDVIQTADNPGSPPLSSPEIPTSNYPDQINVPYTGTVTGVKVTLSSIDAFASGGQEGLFYTQVVLVSPTGKALVLLGGVGQPTDSVSGLTMNIADGNPSMPYEPPPGGGLDLPTSGTQNYEPTDILNNEGQGGGVNPELPGTSITLTSTDWAQPDGSATLTGIFSGVAASGDWKLYLADWMGNEVKINGWSLTLTIDQSQLSTTTTVTGNTDPAIAGNSVTYTATVTSSGSPVTAGGTMAFYGNGGSTAISSCSAQSINGSGQATCAVTLTAGTAAQCESTTVPTFPVVCQGGNTDIVAKYSGVNNSNGDYGASTSGSYTQWVGGTITNPQTDQYCNTNPIYASTGEPATAYPSYITVSGLSASTVSGVSVQLEGISSISGVAGQFLLVSPDGNHDLDFLDDGFEHTTATPTMNLNFDDTAGQKPDLGTPTDGSSWEAYVNPAVGGHAFTPASGLPASIPSVPGTITYPASNSSNEFSTVFNGATANGNWALYVTNLEDGGQTMTLANGWCITLVPNTGVASTTTVTSSLNPAPVSTSVTYTATVKSGGNPVTSGGTVTFLDNGNNPGGTAEQISLSAGGTASFSSSSLYDQITLANSTTVDVYEGDHTITADYGGSSSVNPSSGSMVERINHATAITAGSGNSFNACNAGPIYSSEGTSGPFTPNPSIITAANLPGTVQAVTLTLENFSTSEAGDIYHIESLLEGPTGAALDFFSGTGQTSNPLTQGNYVFEDGQTSVPTGNFSPGTYQATSELGSDTYTSGYYTAPSSFTYAQPKGSGTFTSVFGNTKPNGNWALFFNANATLESMSAVNGWCLNFTENPVTVTATAGHSGTGSGGNFVVSEQNAAINVSVSTANNTGPTGDPLGGNPLKVIDNLPTGLTYASFTGTDWSCAASSQTVTCTNDDSEASSYPLLTINVNVASSTSTPLTNFFSVSGAGVTSTSSNTDSIAVDQAPTLGITVSHSGNFTQGQNDVWDITVSNTKAGSTTSGTLTVSDTLPSGYTFFGYSGVGWSCSGISTVTCTSTQGVSGGSSYSALTLTVAVPANSPTSVPDQASAFGGGATSGATSNTDTVTVIQVPATLAIAGGSPQSASVTSAFSSPLAVTVTDAGGVPISGQSVTFTAPPGGASGTFSNSTNTITANTNSSGQITEAFTANSMAGSYTVTAQTGSASNNFTLTNLAGPASLVGVFDGSPQSAIIGLSFPTPLTVLVTDTFGNPVSGVIVAFNAPSSGPSASLSSSGTCTTAVNGECSVTATANSTTGSYQVIASIAGGTTNANFSLTNDPIPNYVVNTTTDDSTGTASNCTGSPEGTCTLRDALAAAASAGAANITFASSAFPAPHGATITLGSAGTLTIPANTTIQGLTTGSGASLTNLVTVDGASGSNGQFSIFTVNSGTTGAAINNLTIAHGSGTSSFAGGILNSGTLTVTNSTFSNNSVGAGGQGGAIFNYGTLTVAGSTFSSNSAGSVGGAIASAGTLTVTNSTFSGNSTASGGEGGAILNLGPLTVTNSTFSGNTVGSTGQGGGIYNGSTLTVTNSVFSKDIGGECSGTGSGCPSGFPTSGANFLDPTGTVALLSPLGNYGGPTQTAIPQPGSGAICIASASSAASAGITSDQRGVAMSLTTSNASSYTGVGSYCPAGQIDAGAVQTDYSIAFVQEPPATEYTSIAINPSPTVQLSESSSPIALSGDNISIAATEGTLNGTTTESTSGSGLATFGGLSIATTESNDQLAATLTLAPGLPITTDSTPFNVQIPVPAVTRVAPAAGPTSVGTTVIITGLNFTGATAVNFGGLAAASFTVNSGSQITAVSPSVASAQTVDVTVTNTVGTSTTSAADQFTFFVPVATSLTPTLTPSNTTFVYNNQPTILVAVSPSAATGTLAATLDSSTSLTVTPNGGGNFSVALPATPLTVGSHSIALAFTGTGVYESSAGSISLTVTTPAFVVNTTADDAIGTASNCTSTPEGTCTLRDALAASSAAGAANITFAAGVTGTITLTNGTLNVTSNATISGPGVGLLTVSGNNAVQVFNVASGFTVLITGMTVSGGLDSSGNGGGGIYNGGTLTLNSCAITGNQEPNSYYGGGIFNDVGSSLTISACTISNNTVGGAIPGFGGGLFNYGSATIVNSTFLGNTAVGASPSGGEGGAIGNGSNLILIDSTLSGNKVTDPSNAGGAAGGAIFNSSVLVIEDSTITGNIQAGGTPADLAGGIFTVAASSCTMSNTILAGNTDTSGFPDGHGPFAAVSVGNVIGNGTGISGISNGSNGNQIGSSASPISPVLSTLGNYGGPTETARPLPGSAAICAGSASTAANAGIASDQRGVAMSLTTANASTYTGVGGYCPAGYIDAGAFQTDYAISFTTNPAAAESDGVAFNAAVTLTESGLGINGVTIPVTASAGTLTGSPVNATTGANGVASYSLTMASAGPVSGVTLTATLPAPPTLTATSSQFNLAQDATTTTASNSTATFDSSSQSIALSATVTSSVGVVNEGSVTFSIMNGATLIGSSVSSPVSSGSASAIYTLPAGLAAGTYTIIASYSDTAGSFAASTDNLHTLTIGAASTTTTASNAAASYSSSAQGVTLNATVTSAAGIVNGGTVTFSVFSGATQIGSSTSPATVTNGSASATYTFPGSEPPGTYQIVASYNPANGNLASSSDNAHQLTVTAATTTAASNAMVTYNPGSQIIGLTAMVTSAAGTVNGGIVTFSVFNGATQIGSSTSATVTNGTSSANYTLPAGEPAGTYTIVASFSGVGNFTSSSDNTHLLTINLAATATTASTVSTIYNPSGQNVTLNATVTSSAGIVNSGTVTFTVLQGATLVGTATAATVSAGAASVSYALPGTATAGAYTIQAIYSGLSGSLAGSSDNTHSLTINPIPVFVVSVTTDDVSGVAGNCVNQNTGQSSTGGTNNSNCSLRDALAASASGGGNITFAPTVFAAANTAAQNTITLGTGGTLTIPSNTTITGLTTGSGSTLANLVTVDGASGSNGTFSIFTVNSATVIANLNLTHATNSAIYGNSGNLTVSNCTFTANSSSNNGGAIFSDGSIVVTGSTFTGNTASSEGGAILLGGHLTVSNTTFSGNSAQGGGAILLSSGSSGESAIVSDSTFSGNSATTAAGGAIAVGLFNTLTSNNNIFAGNTDGFHGGAIFNAHTTNASYNVYYNNRTSGSEDDCYSCTSNSNSVLASANPVATLGNYGGPAATMLPLPGSAAICAGSYSLAQSAGISSDERGVAFGATGAGGYCPTGNIDAGAVQSDYALAFSSEPGTSQVSGIAFPAAVTLTEDGSAFTTASETIPLTLTGGSVTSFTGNSAATSAGIANYSLTLTNATAVSGLQLNASLTLNGSVSATAASSQFDLAEPVPTSMTLTFTPSGTTWVYGQPPTASLQVSPAAATGSVSHLALSSSGGLPIPNINNGGNNYSLSLPNGLFTVGSHTIYFNFTGTGVYQSSSGSVTVTVTAPSYVVNTNTDDASGTPSNCTSSPEGTCTLRDALAAAATAGGANIAFDTTVFATAQTITLTNGTLSVPTNTTITGPGVSLLTVSGNSAVRVFNVASGVIASISGMTIANGVDTSIVGGGGIYNNGTLTLSACVVSGNRQTNSGDAAGILNDSSGNLTVNQCAVSNNTASGVGGQGAGLFNQTGGIVTITNSTFSGNTAVGSIATGGKGGAIANGGTVTIIGSTIVGNRTTDPDGAGNAEAGAIFDINASSTLSIKDSTIAGNSSADLIGGIAQGGTCTLSNTILAGNTDVAGNRDGNGTFTDGGHNLIGNGAGITGISNGTNGDLVGISPTLSALGNYGGPTQTMLPEPGSAALCAGSYSSAQSAGISSDQRGVAFGNTGAGGYCPSGSVDIGAVQTDYALAFSTEPEPITPAVVIVPDVNFEAALTLTEDGNPYTASAPSFTLALAASPGGAALTPGGGSTSGDVTTYSGLEVTEAGNYQISATLPLNSANIVAKTTAFNVGQATPVLSFTPSPASQTYGTAIAPGSLDAAASYNSSNIVGNVAYTTSVHGNPVTLVAGATVLPVGTYTITANFTPTDGTDYTTASMTATYTVTSATLGVTASSATMTYGGTVPAITPSYSGFVNGDTSASLTTKPTCSTTATSHSAVGNYPSSCTGAVDANYTIGYTAGSVTVSAATLGVTASSSSMTYGGTVPTITPSYSGFVNGDTSASLTTQPICSTTATTHSAVGGYPSSCTGAVDANYTIGYTAGSVTVGAATLGITASSSTMTYGGTVPAITPSYSGFVNGDTSASLTTKPTCSTTATSHSAVGNYPSSCTGAVDANYTIGYTAGSVAVGQATLAVTASSGTMTYGGTVPTITPSYSGFVNGDTSASLTTQPTCSTTATSHSAVGGYPSSCTGAVDANYTIGYTAGSVTVGAATLAVTASSGTMTYGGAVPVISPAYNGFVGTDSAASLTTAPTCSTTATSTSPAGSYPSTCSGAVDANYTISYVAGSVSVTQAGLIVTAANTSTTYGTAPTVSPSYSGFATGNTPASLTAAASCSSTVTVSTPAGSYAGANTCAGAVDPNYAISYVPGTATVTQAAQSIVFIQPATPVTYGIAPISLSATASSGLAVTFSVVSGPGSISGSALAVTGQGTIVIAANQAGNANYTAAPQVTRSITVNSTTLIITANNASKVYGTANPAFTGSVTGQQNGDTFTESFATSATVSSPVGSYTIVPSVAGANLADYTQSVTDGSLTITQAASATTLAVGSTSITPGESVTLTAAVKDASSGSTGTPTGTVSFYDGTALLNSTPAVLSGGVATYATSGLAPGVTHTITATYSGDVNFTGSTSTASAATNITVAALDFTITLPGPTSLTVVPGQSISYQVTVTPDYGAYAGTVSFAVAGLPSGATATFSPASIPANGGPQTVTVTIQTAPATAMNRERPGAGSRGLTPIALGFLLLIGVGSLRKRRKALRGLLCVLVLLSAGAAATMVSGCGSNSGFFAQAPQNYTVTLTATSGNLQHSTTITLNVQ